MHLAGFVGNCGVRVCCHIIEEVLDAVAMEAMVVAAEMELMAASMVESMARA